MEQIMKLFEDAGLLVVDYPQTKMLNIQDTAGVVHSYYTTTGTVILRLNNNSRSKYKIYLKNCLPSEVLALCLRPTRIKNMIKEQFDELK